MKNLGFAGKITELIQTSDYEGFELARVIIEHKERYVIQTSFGILNAEITGNLRFSAKSRLDFPAVGDWVKVTIMDNNTAIILSVFPRISVLKRQAIGKYGEPQLIAANIDYAFVVQSVGHDFNLKRLDRYLTICYSANIEPIVLLTKIDLIEQNETEQLVEQIRDRAKGITIIPLSIEIASSLEILNKIFEPYKTYCFIGSSGVGKSTIVNWLNGTQVLKTNEISSSTNKGKHTTSHRELMILSNGSIIIDTPGMREVGMTESSVGIELTYDEIVDLANNCKFNDCSHTSELGCAVLKAVEEGDISVEAYENYHKLIREQIHFASTIVEKRKKGKDLAKLYKAVLAERRKNKY